MSAHSHTLAYLYCIFTLPFSARALSFSCRLLRGSVCAVVAVALPCLPPTLWVAAFPPAAEGQTYGRAKEPSL